MIYDRIVNVNMELDKMSNLYNISSLLISKHEINQANVIIFRKQKLTNNFLILYLKFYKSFNFFKNELYDYD